MSDFSALENLFAAYFHQDWAVEHDSPDAVIEYFRDGESPEQVARTLAEARALMTLDLDEAALAERIAGLGSEFDPTRNGGTWRGWLQQIIDGLDGHT